MMRMGELGERRDKRVRTILENEARIREMSDDEREKRFEKHIRYTWSRVYATHVNDKLKEDTIAEKMELTPGYVLGFIDGEGGFSIFISQPFNKKEAFNLCFSISQTKEEGKIVLRAIQKYFNCGLLSERKNKTNNNHSDSYMYKVYPIKDIINILIPFFDKYSPIIKQKDYQIWREAAFLISEKKHLTEEGGRKIKELREELRKDNPKRWHRVKE